MIYWGGQTNRESVAMGLLRVAARALRQIGRALVQAANIAVAIDVLLTIVRSGHLH